MLRFRTPDDGVTVVDDVIRGPVTFANEAVEDFALLRSDGTPMFLLANVVDDLEMGVTNVVRGDEHLPNTPKQQLLWEALGAAPPVWAHVPVLVNESRKKLSKRRDKVALEQFRDEGYLADAMVNYLMTLGWAPKHTGEGGEATEIVPWHEIVAQFRLEDVTHSPAYFDLKKLAAFNGEYIRKLPTDAFVAACEPFLPTHYDRAVFARVAPLVQTRVVTLADAAPMVDFLIRDDAGDRPRFVAEGDAPTVVAQRARRDGRGVRPHAVGRRLAQARPRGHRHAPRREAGQGAGAGAGGGHRTKRRPTAVRVAWKCSAARRRSSASMPRSAG